MVLDPQAEITEIQARRMACVPRGDMASVAHINYERRLAGMSADVGAAAAAREYVSALVLCSEWEGYHDCPEMEASYASQYLVEHPDGPLAFYLPLLAAHRWACAAEGYEYEQKPDGAARSWPEFEKHLASARTSTSPLVRMAADALGRLRSCFR